MYKKNWQAICQVDDLYLRLFVSLATDDEPLAKLQAGFPELFTTDEASEPRVPASVLRHLSREISFARGGDPTGEDLELDTEFTWLEAMENFNIPKAWSWDEADIAPLEIRRQLVGQPLRGGMKITYQGNEYVVALYYTDDATVERLGRIIKRTPRDPSIVLVLAKFIDVDA